jgi:hypothetical protein
MDLAAFRAEGNVYRDVGATCVALRGPVLLVFISPRNEVATVTYGLSFALRERQRERVAVRIGVVCHGAVSDSLTGARRERIGIRHGFGFHSGRREIAIFFHCGRKHGSRTHLQLESDNVFNILQPRRRRGTEAELLENWVTRNDRPRKMIGVVNRASQ